MADVEIVLVGDIENEDVKEAKIALAPFSVTVFPIQRFTECITYSERDIKRDELWYKRFDKRKFK